jgi:MFS family permease
MEKILGYSALKAGVGMVPMLGTFAAISFVAGRAYNRLGPKLAVGIGAAGLTVGPFLLSLAGADSGYWELAVGLAATGIGAGFFYPSVTTAGVTALDPSRTSLAGGLVYMFQIAGGALGLAVTTTIFTITSENNLSTKVHAIGAHVSEQQVSVMHGVLAGTDAGTAALHKLPGAAQSKVLDFVDTSFVHGVQAGFRYCAIVAVIGLLISIFFVGGGLAARRRAAVERAGA